MVFLLERWLRRRARADREAHRRGELAGATLHRRRRRRAFLNGGATAVKIACLLAVYWLIREPASAALSFVLCAVLVLGAGLVGGWRAALAERAEVRGASYACALEAARRGDMDVDDVQRAGRREAIRDASLNMLVVIPVLFAASSWREGTLSWLDASAALGASAFIWLFAVLFGTPWQDQIQAKIGTPGHPAGT